MKKATRESFVEFEFFIMYYPAPLTPAVQPIAGGRGKFHYTPTLPAKNA